MYIMLCILLHCISQEELKIAYLLESIDVEEEMTKQEQELKSKLKEMVVHKVRKLEDGGMSKWKLCPSIF